MNQTTNDDIENKSNSQILDLETLSSEYKNLLIEYRQAVANYVNYLREEAEMPCGSYSTDSTGISQQCYDEIWKKAGCGGGTENPDASSSWAQKQTLTELLNDVFLWATDTDYKHRMGCYGNPGNSYIIIGIGTDGRLYSRQGLSAPWTIINDNTANCQAICTMSDGKGMLGISGNNLNRKSSYDTNWIGKTKNACCAISVAMGQDGTVIGVGTDNLLYSKAGVDAAWQPASSAGEVIYSVAIAPDGSIFVIGSDQQIWKKSSFKNLPTQQWQNQGSCCVKAITIAPDGTLIGVGTDNQLYTKPDYKDLSSNWDGPHNSENSSCCVIGVTTVINPTYNASSYNSGTKPPINIDRQPMDNIKGAAYWGTSSVGQNNSATLQECEASCAQTVGCTGATFNANARTTSTCLLRGGVSNVSPGTSDDYAIITKGKKLLNIVNIINQKLTSVNKKIQEITVNSQEEYDTNAQLRHFKTAELVSQIEQLNKDRAQIDQLGGKHQTLDEAQVQTGLTVVQKQYTFMLLALLAIIAIYLIYKYTLGSSSSINGFQSGGGGSVAHAYYIVIGLLLLIMSIKMASYYLLRA
jgi:hypothetical protein